MGVLFSPEMLQARAVKGLMHAEQNHQQQNIVLFGN